MLAKNHLDPFCLPRETLASRFDQLHAFPERDNSGDGGGSLCVATPSCWYYYPQSNQMIWLVRHVGSASVGQACLEQESLGEAVYLQELQTEPDPELHPGIWSDAKHYVKDSSLARSGRRTPPVFDDGYSGCMGTPGYTASPLARYSIPSSATRGFTHPLFPFVARVARSDRTLSVLLHREVLGEMQTAKDRPTQVGVG